MRDQQTAEIGMRAAMTGHLVLSTLHTNDAISTPVRLVDMGVPAYMVALSLHLVLAQRLVRLVCPHCAEHYEPTAQEAEWLREQLGDAALDAPLRKGRGCHDCNDSGYSGRTGVYEVLEMTQSLVDALAHPQAGRFNELARAALGGQTLAHDALRLVIEGRTTLEEAMRVGAQLDD
jgi:MSHA biogenesis protein MshE